MTVCHVITGLANGGAEAVLYRLCTAPAPVPCRHVVVSLTGRGVYAERFEEAGVEVHCLGMPRGSLRISGLRALYRLLRGLKPDVVQTWMYHSDLVGGAVARMCGVRRIAWGIHNSTLAPGHSSQRTRVVARACALLSPWLCDRIVTCSVKAEEVHRALGYRADKFVNIPNGYPLDRFAPDAEAGRRVRDSLGLREGLPVAGMVARYDPQKDHANLIRALGLLKEQGRAIHCLLVGSGAAPDNVALLSGVRDAGLEESVHFLGPRSDIPAVMNALDLHVLSSAYGEAFPNVLAEAMACGTPCVTTDVGDGALIVGDTGWVVPPGSSEALASSMGGALDAMRDGPRWQERRTACRQRIVDRFSLEQMVDSYWEVWQSLGAGNGLRRRGALASDPPPRR
jgi:glycosyltransferase involved in cell wall biosynthesis